MHKNCKGCIYNKLLSGCFNEYACHYAIDTGKLRGTPASECTVKCTDKKAKEKNRYNNTRNWNDEPIRNAKIKHKRIVYNAN